MIAGDIVDRSDGMGWMTMDDGQECQMKTNEMPKGDDQGCWYGSISSWTSHLALVDWGVTITFSLPAAGSILMVTFFGLGVLVLLPLSVEMRTTGTGACASSPSELRPGATAVTVRAALVVVMDGRPPCVGQAVLRGPAAGLLTPGTSLFTGQPCSTLLSLVK